MGKEPEYTRLDLEMIVDLTNPEDFGNVSNKNLPLLAMEHVADRQAIRKHI